VPLTYQETEYDDEKPIEFDSILAARNFAKLITE
jgi:hypothetical protein